MYIGDHVKYLLFLSDSSQIEFFNVFSKNTQISNFMKNLPVRTELFHADGQTERLEEAKNLFSQFSNELKT